MTKKQEQDLRRDGETHANEGAVGPHVAELAHTDRDLHIPLSSRAVFWQPRHVAVSDELVHVPYLFWLTETVRPRNIVQIGLGDGVGFLALCQAVDKLNLEAPCIGIVPSDDSNIEQPLPVLLQEHHSTHYGDFSYVLPSSTGGSLSHFKDIIDLLVVNAALSDTLVITLLLSLLSRLSPHATVVVTNCDRPSEQGALSEFFAKYPSIRIEQDSHMIETILVGEKQPERLRRLSQLEPSAPGALAARQVFRRLGQGLVNTERAKATKLSLAEKHAEVEGLKEQLRLGEDEQSKQLATLQAHLFDTKAEIKDLHILLSKTQSDRDSLRVRCEDLSGRVREYEKQVAQTQNDHNLAITKLTEEISTEKQARESAESQLQDLDSSKKSIENKLESMQNNLQELEMQVQARIADIAVLTADYEKNLTNADSKCLKFNKQLDAHLSTIAVLTKRIEKQDAELQKFFNSTSWKITAPARKVIDKIRGNQKPTTK